MATETDVATLIKNLSPVDIDFTEKNQIIKYALNVASAVEQMSTHLKGSQKTDLVLRAIREGIHMSSLSQDAKDSTIMWINVVLPHALTAAVSVSKGEYQLQQVAANCCVSLITQLRT